MTKSIRLNSKGFPLVEVLVTVTIIGVISAIGIRSYNGYVKTAEESVAKNNLRSISLGQDIYFSERKRYYNSSYVSSINRVLFLGKKTLDSKSNYKYKIIRKSNKSGYIAYAIPKNKGYNDFCIDDNGDLQTGKCKHR